MGLRSIRLSIQILHFLDASIIFLHSRIVLIIANFNRMWDNLSIVRKSMWIVYISLKADALGPPFFFLFA
jgi:hypothetical protein